LSIPVDAIPGTTYEVRLFSNDGYERLATSSQFTVTDSLPTPANDDLSNAERIGGRYGSVNGSLVRATGEGPEQFYSFDGGSAHTTVWYAWTAPYTGTATFDTCSSANPGLQTVVQAWTQETVPWAGWGTLTLRGSSSPQQGGQTCGDGGSLTKVTFPVVGGWEYRIQVDTRPGAAGDGSFTLRWAVANDTFADAVILDEGLWGMIEGTTVDATSEAGEPATCSGTGCGVPGGPNATTWYRWTSPITGPVAFDTCSSDFDTMLAAYTGNTMATLTRVAEGDDTPGCGDGTRTRVTFNVVQGQTYWIQIDGRGGATGYVNLQWTTIFPPANDAFAGATVLTGASGSINGSNGLASAEAGEPQSCPSCGAFPGPYRTLWYRWTPTVSGTALLTLEGLPDCCGSNFQGVFAVYTGAGLGSLSRVASQNFSGDLNVGVTAGTTYWIQVDGAFSGSFVLHWTGP
jgi:hypothetical protein